MTKHLTLITPKQDPLIERIRKLERALLSIADTPLYGEPIYDPDLRNAAVAAGEYNKRDEAYEPERDTESNQLRECVEEARMALGLPLDRGEVHHA